MNCCIENKSASVVRMRYLMNTFCRIQAEGEDSGFIEEAIEDAFLELRRIEKVFSRYLPDSQVSRINCEASHSLVQIDAEAFGLIARALEISQLTFGAFDITVGAAIDLWRLAQERGTLPQEEHIREVLTRMVYQNIVLDKDTLGIHFKKSGMKIDLGALAKGYALDRAVTIFKERGISQAQIDLGGNIHLLAHQPQTIAIRNPLSPDEIITTVEINNQSISTSANYERFFSIGKTKFGHLLNPLTGYPADSDVLSASVISEDALLADALSTAIFILGLNKGKEIFQGIAGTQALIINRDVLGRGMKIIHWS